MIARLPSLNGLRAFEAAARHLSFTLAASELNVTQTAISHQIRRLEEELGIRLFIRKNRAEHLAARRSIFERAIARGEIPEGSETSMLVELAVEQTPRSITPKLVAIPDAPL